MRLDKRKWQIVCALFPSILMVTLCLRQLFRVEFSDSLYIELQRYADGAPASIEDALVQLGYAREVPLVATNQAYFASEDDYRAHDALVCIAEGRYLNEEDRRRLTPDHRLKTSEEPP